MKKEEDDTDNAGVTQQIPVPVTDAGNDDTEMECVPGLDLVVTTPDIPGSIPVNVEMAMEVQAFFPIAQDIATSPTSAAPTQTRAKSTRVAADPHLPPLSISLRRNRGTVQLAKPPGHCEMYIACVQGNLKAKVVKTKGCLDLARLYMELEEALGFPSKNVCRATFSFHSCA